MILDKLGIAVRTGHHCAQPVMDQFSIPGTIRASFAVYNNAEDVNRLVDGVKKAQKSILNMANIKDIQQSIIEELIYLKNG